jgi:hypothetical protein
MHCLKSGDKDFLLTGRQSRRKLVHLEFSLKKRAADYFRA